MTVVEKIDKFLYEGDIGPSDLKMAKRIIGKKIDKAKSKKDLDKIYNDLNKHVKKWRMGVGFDDDVINYLKKAFDNKMKEFD